MSFRSFFSGTGSAPWRVIQGSLTLVFRCSPGSGRIYPCYAAADRIRLSIRVRLYAANANSA
jgi:hypothetical protein